MGIPALAVQQPGLGAVTADNLNTYVQGGCLLGYLQNFIGQQNMTVYMLGYVTPGDGGQGVWYWNGGLTSGNNTTTIVPNGSVQGGWVRVTFDTQLLVYQYIFPTSGFSVTIAPPTQALIINPSGTLAAGTVTLSSVVPDGFKITISCTEIITTFTLVGTNIANIPTALAAGVPISYMWSQIAASWFRV